MEWNSQQSAALSKATRWFRSYCANPKTTPQVFRLFGYAGTGKSTLADQINQDCTNGQAKFMTPTAKSASVLRSKGALNADTAHSQIYTPKDKSKQRLRDLEAYLAKAQADANRVRSGEPTPENKRMFAMFNDAIEKLKIQIKEEQDKLSRPTWAVNPDADVKNFPLFILDETSMFASQIGQDLESYGIPILALGDPAQLPPVGGTGYFTSQEPDVMLTDIRRQALDNPIIYLSKVVREGGVLKPGSYGSSRVIPRSSLTPEIVTDCDQLLVGRNTTRRASNNRIRQLSGYDQQPFPIKGERLVCLRNNRELGIYNGVTYLASEDAIDSGDNVTMWIQEEDTNSNYVVGAHRSIFLNEELPWYEKKDHEEFDYGYALTVHKSQGSQWARTTLFDEWSMQDSRRQWLYTGLTRAADSVTCVQF